MILSAELLTSLTANGIEARRTGDQQHDNIVPPVMLCLPNSPQLQWLLASVDPDDQDLAFALMVIAGVTSQLGYVRISDLEALRGYQDRPVYHHPMLADASPLPLREYVDMAKITGDLIGGISRFVR